MANLLLFLHTETPSDHFWRFSNDFAGSYHEPIIEELVTDTKGYGLSAIESSLISPDSVQTSRRCIQGSALSTPPQSCPSLASDDSGDGRGASRASLAPRSASVVATSTGDQKSMCLPTLSQSPDPSIFTSIRQVLSSDPSYAEDVISAVSQLPHEKRNLLFEHAAEPADDSGPPTSSGEPSKKRPRTSSDKPNGSGGHQPTRGAAGGGRGGGDDDDGGDEDGAGGKGDPPPPSKKPNKDKNRRWICPYCLAYSDILQMGPAFSHCWPGNMTEVHLWRDHLKKHHSPSARKADPHAKKNARFYMDSDQWEAVFTIIKGWKGRPRSLDMWLSHWKGLFLEVWRIIFPKDRFPDFKEPCSPFHLDSDEITNLTRQAKTLLGPIYNARKKRAVRTDTVARSEDFRPSEAEVEDMMSEAVAVALFNSPGAVGATQWLAHASPQVLQTAATDYAHAPGSQPVPALHDVPPKTHAQASMTVPSPDTASKTSASSSIGTNCAQTAPPISPAVPLTLFADGTRVTMDLLPANTSYLPTEGRLQLALPAAFYMTNFNQAPCPPPSIPLTMATPNTPTSVAQSAIDLGLGIEWQPSTQPLGAQGISMQVVQGTLSPEEAILSTLGPMMLQP